MTPLLRRVATCASLTAIGLSARAEAQIPTKPGPVVGGQIQRPLPTAPAAQQAAPPVVQQSPNGLYALSITDEGIELRGPSGGVKITSAGIEIGAPNSSRVTISTAGMELWGDKVLKLNAAQTVEIVNGPGANIVRLSPAGMELKANRTLQLRARDTAEIINGPDAGAATNSVRLSNTGMELNGKGTVRLKAGGALEMAASANAELRASAYTLIQGALVRLGCPVGNPVARVNDLVTGTTGGPGGPLMGGKVAAGSATVFAC
jgi:hypothetical protein